MDAENESVQSKPEVPLNPDLDPDKSKTNPNLPLAETKDLEIHKNVEQSSDTKSVKGHLANGADDRCSFFVLRKKRKCKMMVRPGKRFCGEHAHLEDDQIETGSFLTNYSNQEYL